MAPLLSGEEPFVQFWTRELGTVVQEEMSFKDISYLQLWWLIVQWSRTICAILVEGIM